QKLTYLQEEYTQIMNQYSECMDDITNEISTKWMEEYNSLTFNIEEDYLHINNIQEYDSEEFNNAINEHENILEILGYHNKKIDQQQFLDNTNKLPRKNSNVIERMHHIPPSYNFKAVENTQWKVKGLMSNIYRRLHPLIPSSTVIAYGGGGTGGYHYEYNRQALTNRERARLQTFPDDYLFNGTTTEIRAQIGEAVPPLTSYWIEKVVTEILALVN
ncbi:MAG: DNA cytosine methyltransferase, partial [Methanosphaera sp.]|nr:DNA cytosine methyltransferase [Methanosphaera sp.]